MAQHAAKGADATLAKETIREVAPQARDTISRETATNGARTIFGFLGVAVIFALIGNEIKAKTKVSPAGPQLSVLSDSGTIIFGGFTAAAALTLISHAGEGGNQLAVGLAAVTMVSSVLVYGGPVWKALGVTLGGSKPSTPTTPLGGAQGTWTSSGYTPPSTGSHPIYIV